MFPGDSLKRGTGEMTTGRDFREVGHLDIPNFTTMINNRQDPLRYYDPRSVSTAAPVVRTSEPPSTS